jgi:hypothetical protein
MQKVTVFDPMRARSIKAYWTGNVATLISVVLRIIEPELRTFIATELDANYKYRNKLAFMMQSNFRLIHCNAIRQLRNESETKLHVWGWGVYIVLIFE